MLGYTKLEDFVRFGNMLFLSKPNRKKKKIKIYSFYIKDLYFSLSNFGFDFASYNFYLKKFRISQPMQIVAPISQ